MNKPMIENSDRGITLNKSLAWTIGSALLVGGIWIGVELTTLAGKIDKLTELYNGVVTRQTEDREGIRQNARDIVTMQTQNARIEQRLTGIEATTNRTDANVENIYRWLQGNNAPPRP